MTLRRLPRPNPGTRPIQRATWLLGEAFAAAHSDPRTFEVFLSIAIERLASESLRLLDKERRP